MGEFRYRVNEIGYSLGITEGLIQLPGGLRQALFVGYLLEPGRYARR